MLAASACLSQAPSQVRPPQPFQPQAQRALDVYWSDWFWRRDWNRFVEKANAYAQKRAEGVIDLKLERQTREAFRKLFPEEVKKCEK